MNDMSANKAQSGLSAMIEHHLRDYFAAHEGILPSAGLYDRILQELERPLLTLTLQACQGNQVKAALLLGINRNTLRKKIRLRGIKVKRGRPLRDDEREIIERATALIANNPTLRHLLPREKSQ